MTISCEFAFRAELAKIAQVQGHWRRLPPGGEGHGPAGEKTYERTWVKRPGGLKPSVKLLPHQTKSIRRFHEAPTGGVIYAWGTGTGKTLAAISAFESARKVGAQRALVVTPAGLRENFAVKNVHKFTKSKAMIATDPAQPVPPDVSYVVVSYDAFRRDPEGWIKNTGADTLIADEMHRLKDPEGETSQALKRGRELVPRFIGLTASIVSNEPAEVVPLVDIATGGEHELGTQREFKRHFQGRQVSRRRGIFGGRTYDVTLRDRVHLLPLLEKHIDYVEDLDASQKPTKRVETIEVPMSKEQHRLYDMAMSGVDPVVRKKIIMGIPINQREALTVFGRLMKARQVSNSLHTVTPGMTLEQAAEQTPKIKKILDDTEEHLRTTPDGQVIIFSNFIHGGADVIHAGLTQRGIPHGLFVGKGKMGQDEASRQKAVDDYLAGKNRVIVITEAGAEGLSLGNTTMIQMADGHYNPERIAQVEGRGIRVGGQAKRPPEEREVIVKRYVSSVPRGFWRRVMLRPLEVGIDEWVYMTAERKQRLNREFRDVLRGKTEEPGRESWYSRIF